MDAAERALLEEAVQGACADEGASADAQLATLGWLDMLAAEPRDAIAVVFEALGATNRAATALDDVVVAALGREPRADLAVLLPAFGAWNPPGASGSDRSRRERERAVGREQCRIGTRGAVMVPTSAASDAPGRWRRSRKRLPASCGWSTAGRRRD